MTLPSIGDVVDDKFRIERKLGEGGTSTIFEARHAITDKRFAIKWLAPELAQNEQAVQLFIHEAKVCGRLEHPNAVQIYDICRNRDSYYLLMELLEGESLEARLQRVQRLSPRGACDILLPCTEALGAAHRLGIVHRDLKPSNIFLCNVEGRSEELPKVLDFGISKLSHKRAEQGTTATAVQPISGTPLYMAPEQMRGQPPDPRFDIYALGVVLYELVAGQPPFDCENLEELARKISEEEPAPLHQMATVEPAFAEIVARAMARDIDDRFATMAEFAHALRPYATPRPAPSSPAIEARPSEVPVSPARRSMKITTPGVWAVLPELAAAMRASRAAEQVTEAAAAASDEPEPVPAEPVSAVEAESAGEMTLADGESSGQIPLIDGESSGEIPLLDGESSSEIPLIEAEPEPEESAPLLALVPTEVPQTIAATPISAPPISAPPRAAPAPRRVAPPPPRAAVAPHELDDLDAAAHRSHGKRWLGTAIALGGALLTWYALTSTSREPVPTASSPITQARPTPQEPEPEPTALRAAPATAEISAHQILEPGERASVRRAPALKSASKTAEPAKAKPAKRASKSKRGGTPKESSASPKREVAARELGAHPTQGMSLPSADLSRGDF